MGNCLSAFRTTTEELVSSCRMVPRALYDYLHLDSCFRCAACSPANFRPCLFCLLFLVCWPCTCCLLCCQSVRWCIYVLRRRRNQQSSPAATQEEVESLNQRLHSEQNDETTSLEIHGDCEDGLKVIFEDEMPPGNSIQPSPPPSPRSLRMNKNYWFFMNKLKSKPRGDFIDEIHKKWWNDYDRLETHHGFIQWLFPLPEPGVNPDAQELNEDEIEKILKSQEAKDRLLKSYKMMLGFYGMELVSDETGEVKKAENWKSRFANLKRNTHNNLRISRILQCLGLLGFEHLKYPFIEFMVNEIIVEKTLPGCHSSCFNFWMETLEGDSYWKIKAYASELEDKCRKAKEEEHTSVREQKSMPGSRQRILKQPASVAVAQDHAQEKKVAFQETTEDPVKLNEPGDVPDKHMDSREQDANVDSRTAEADEHILKSTTEVKQNSASLLVGEVGDQGVITTQHRDSLKHGMDTCEQTELNDVDRSFDSLGNERKDSSGPVAVQPTHVTDSNQNNSASLLKYVITDEVISTIQNSDSLEHKQAETEPKVTDLVSLPPLTQDADLSVSSLSALELQSVDEPTIDDHAFVKNSPDRSVQPNLDESGNGKVTQQ